VGQVAIRLVDEQHRARLVGERREREQRVAVEHRPGRIVRRRDRDQLRRPDADPRGDHRQIEVPSVVVREIDDVEVGADRARCLEVRCVVGTDDDRMVAGFEKRRGDREQRGRGTGRDEDVAGTQSVATRGNGLAQHRIAEVIAVAEQEVVDVDVDAEVAEPAIGHRALR
jgi:hypothetical protein